MIAGSEVRADGGSAGMPGWGYGSQDLNAVCVLKSNPKLTSGGLKAGDMVSPDGVNSNPTLPLGYYVTQVRELLCASVSPFAKKCQLHGL